MGTKASACIKACNQALDSCIARCSDDCCKYQCIDVATACKRNCDSNVSNSSPETEPTVADLLEERELSNQAFATLADAFHELLGKYFEVIGYVPPPATPEDGCGCTPT